MQGYSDRVISPDKVVKFLTQKFDERYLMAYINTFWSAISKTASTWMGKPLGKNELVVKCIAKMEKMQPKMPAYKTTWNMSILVHWLQSLSEKNIMNMKTRKMASIVLFKIVDCLDQQMC